METIELALINASMRKLARQPEFGTRQRVLRICVIAISRV